MFMFDVVNYLFYASYLTQPNKFTKQMYCQFKTSVDSLNTRSETCNIAYSALRPEGRSLMQYNVMMMAYTVYEVIRMYMNEI